MELDIRRQAVDDVLIRRLSLPVVCAKSIEGLPDATDAPFAEAALAAAAPLVTGNLKHFPSRKLIGIRVLTPFEFLNEFRRHAGED